MQDHAYRDAADERWFSYDGTQRNCGRLRCAGACVDLSFDIFYLRHSNNSCSGGRRQMKKFLNIALLLSFWVTIMVPVTGILIHKLASAVFLLLSIVHTIVYRKRMSRKRWGLLIILLLAFFTGLFGMIFDEFRMIEAFHRVNSIILVFFLAIHIFVFYRKYEWRRR